MRLLKALPALLLLALTALVVLGHVRLQPVLTGSMAPRYPAGTLVAVTPVRAEDLHVGEIVMFVPPRPYRTPTGGPVMHRIVSMERVHGRLQLRTKGDANAVKDPWIVDASAGGLTRLRWGSVTAGRAVAMVRHSLSGPAVLLWPGLLLLWFVTRQRPVRRYTPRHAA
ncbi:MAG: signal peptidase I [Mycobacteriales bacterium]